ncbi:hypothetical protein LguiB_004726 [Lonicera macranthoides]
MANSRIARFVTEVAPPQVVSLMRCRASKMLDTINEEESTNDSLSISPKSQVNCNLKLAELHYISSINLTFLNTHHIHRRLFRHTDAYNRRRLPEDNPHSAPAWGVTLMGGIRGVTTRWSFPAA